MTLLLVSQVLLWIIVLAMGVVIVALTRQLGVLYERLAPVGALSIGTEIEVGQRAPRLVTRSLAGGITEIGVEARVGEAHLLLFVAPGCPVCKKLIPVAHRFGRSERLKVLFVGDGKEEEQVQFAKQQAIEPRCFVNSADVGVAFRVSKIPYAVLIDHEGVIVAKGLVNSREHLESLVVARETGYASIQSYLTENKVTTIGG